MNGWRRVPIVRKRNGELVPAPGWTGGHRRDDLPWPAGAIGEATGCPDDAMMLDVDQYLKDGKQKRGADQLRKLEAELGALPPTFKITSRGPDDPGGKLLFRIGPDVELKGSVPGCDIEVVQRHHRFGWAPGTVHPTTGALSRCYGPDGRECPLPEPGSLPWFPESWAAHLRASARDTVPGDDGLPDDDGRCPVALAHLQKQDFAGASPRGERANRAVTYLKRMDAEGHQIGGLLDDLPRLLPNTAAGDVAGMWRQRVPDDIVWRDIDCAGGNCMGEYLALEAAERAAVNAPVSTAEPPLYVFNPDGTWTGRVTYPDPVNPVTGGQATAGPLQPQPVASLLGAMKDGAYLNSTTFRPLRFHCGGLVPQGLSLLVGPPKIGKSWLILLWALEKAKLGQTVVYFALEDDDAGMQERCKILLGGKPVPDGFRYICDIPPGWLVPALREAMSLGSEDDPALVVLDTLGVAMNGEPVVRGETDFLREYRVGRTLKAVADEHPGSALLVTHHNRKASAADFIDSVSGTHGMTGSVDTILVLTRPRHESEGLLQVTGRRIREGEYSMLHASGRWSLYGGSLAAAAQRAASQRLTKNLGDLSVEIVAFVTESKDGARAADVAEKFDLSPNEATVYLSRLYGSGRISLPARGLYKSVGYVGNSLTSENSARETNTVGTVLVSRSGVTSPYVKNNITNTLSCYNPDGEDLRDPYPTGLATPEQIARMKKLRGRSDDS